jgi:predicted amidophosphoribosyltransferase
VSPRTVDFDALPTTPVTLDADCVGCHRAATPDGLCPVCAERATEYEAHDRRCMCPGCVWYRAAVNALAERGLS